MQTQKGRNGSSEAPKKIRPQAIRQLKTTGLDSGFSSSSNQVRTPKERSPKIVDRRSPKSPVTEKKRPSRISELESQVTQLSGELKKAKDQLSSSESSKNDAESPESTNSEINMLKSKLTESLSLMETMKSELLDSRSSEAQAQALALETLHQLETAKKSVEALRSDGSKSTEAYHSIASELEKSKARVKELEALLDSRNPTDDLYPIAGNQVPGEENKLEAEVVSLRREIERLRSSERKAYELVEQIKSESLIKETELTQAKTEIEELKADLMDKETELQGISEENDDLNSKLQKSQSSVKLSQLEAELAKMKEIISENERLRSEIGKKENNTEAADKLELVLEEVDSSSKRVARLTEQLELTQLASLEMEADLRRVKVQSDQWRKAAEAAAAMLTTGNNGKFAENNGKFGENNGKFAENGYNTGKIGLGYGEDMENEMLRKRNGNMLKKIGVLWKKA